MVFGKTNVPLLLADWQSFNSIHGTCNNPWDLARTPGGSSGGSAAALAAGLTGLDTGSDIGASIRNPAHYCGVFGHKPTWEIVSGRGQALPGDHAPTDIAVVGPLARSASDLRLAFDLLAGADGPAARGWRLELPGPRRESLRSYRVGVLLSDPQAEVEQSCQDAIAALARWLEGEGVTVEMGAKPEFPTGEAMEVYTMLLRAATSKRMSDEMIARAREDLGRLPADAIPYRRRMLEAQTMLHRDWLRWNERRYELMAGWEAWFETYDLLLCPAASSPAFPPRPGGRAPRSDDHRQWKGPARRRSALLGRLSLRVLPALDRRSDRTGGRPARRHPDHRAPVRRPDLPAHGGADRGRLLPLHAPAGVLRSAAGRHSGAPSRLLTARIHPFPGWRTPRRR